MLKPFSTYDLSLNGASVDGKVSEVRKEFLGTVLALDELEQVGSVIDELPAK